MATYYIKHDAGGVGVGTFVDPWTLDQAIAGAAAGDLVYVLAGTYTLAGAKTFATNGTRAQPIFWIARNLDNSPWLGDAPIAVFDADGGVFHALTMPCHYNRLAGVAVCNMFAGGGFRSITITGEHNLLYRCRGHIAGSYGIYATGLGTTLISCEADDFGNTAASVGIYLSGAGSAASWCRAHDGTGVGFFAGMSTGTTWTGCISDSNTTYGFQYSRGNEQYPVYGNSCIAYGNGSHGFYSSAAAEGSPLVLTNSIIAMNGGWGVEDSPGGIQVTLGQTAFFNNTSGEINVPYWELPGNGKITLAADPFVDAANGDFRLVANNELRAAGLPGAFLHNGALTGWTSDPDIGAWQSRQRVVLIG